MGSERLFVDTWGWLVLANRRDPAFERVSQVRAEAAGRPGAWVTTDYVLDETITRLFAASSFAGAQKFTEGIFEASREGLLDIEPITRERFNEAWSLHLQYEDKPRISFTDLTSFVTMREMGLRYVLTKDAHFEQAGFVKIC
jgi:predicted nucleic acid-binding protein